MAKDIWLISDTHFNHSNILGFLRPDGTPLRPGFKDVQEMNERMMDNWVSLVKDGDKIYHLGDIAMGDKQEGVKLIGKLPGSKNLILGNHDSPEMKLYTPYFKHIYSSRVLDKVALVHIPVHPSCLSAKVVGCIHGHEHGQHPGEFGKNFVDISVENTDYKPVAFEEIKLQLLRQIQ